MVNNMRSKGILVTHHGAQRRSTLAVFRSTNSPYDLRRRPRSHQIDKLLDEAMLEMPLNVSEWQASRFCHGMAAREENQSSVV